MISKKLLREALGMYATPYDITQKDNKILFTWDNSSGSANSDMSICELAQLCKEWAFDNKVSISSAKTLHHGWTATIPHKMFTADTEPETIFLACEYILKETK